MLKIIEPIDRELLKKELTPERFIRNTNNGNNKIYIISNENLKKLIETSKFDEYKLFYDDNY